MVEKVTKLALASRLFLLMFQLIANCLIPDHNPDDVFKSPVSPTQRTYYLDSLSDFLFGGLRRWDAEYFLHVAEYGYTYENTLAFYPLYPAFIHGCTKIFMAITFNSCSFHQISLTIAILLNLYFFYRAANCLYDLTQRIFSDPNKSWNVVVLFCFNPASVFFTAPYSESLYCWLTFSLMLECSSSLRIFRTLIPLSLSMLTRSNGLINLAYPMYFLIRKLFLKKYVLVIFFKILIILILGIVPLSIYNFYVYQYFCSTSNTTLQYEKEIRDYAIEKSFLLAGQSRLSGSKVSPWCDYSVPFPYSYVQNHYWNVGLFKYYNFIQIPNFLLALPILTFLIHQTFQYLVNLLKQFRKFSFIDILQKYKSIPFVIHCIFLIGFCICFVHIQISTRLIASANPCLFWFAADSLPKKFTEINSKSKHSILLYWFGGYYLIGTILFSNFLPWT